jgi:predicted alpha/beta hydrolase family esterase
MTRTARYLAGAAIAAFFLSAARAEWSATDRALLAGAMAFHLADWRQTRVIAGDDRWYERNPILGRYPSTAQVDRYFLATGLAMAAAAHFLPQYRRALLLGYLTVGVFSVGNNLALGVRVGL